jgi:hypothetical protein
MALELYSIGNALVDQEFLITEDFLQQQQLQKGTMQLADQAAQPACPAQGSGQWWLGGQYHRGICGTGWSGFLWLPCRQ